MVNDIYWSPPHIARDMDNAEQTDVDKVKFCACRSLSSGKNLIFGVLTHFDPDVLVNGYLQCRAGIMRP
jgi:hypothetical protein